MRYGVCTTWVQQYVMGLLMTLAVLAGLGTSAAAAAASTRPQTVLILGDSLSAAYGLQPEQGWPALLDERIKARSLPWRVVNASVSGETTSGGLVRMAGELQRNQPQLVVIALGANDGLRGLPLEQTRAQLAAMIEAALAAKARVLLIGMQMPPNYGPDYTRGFAHNYQDLAAQYHIALLPFLLEPIASERDAFQADNLHPVAAAQPRLLEHVWAVLGPMLGPTPKSSPEPTSGR